MVFPIKPNFEAIRFLFRVPPGVEIRRYPSVCTEEGIPIEENIRIMEKAIQERISRDNH